MARKVAKGGGRKGGANASPSSTSTPRSNVGMQQSSNRRTSMLYQVYDAPSSGNNNTVLTSPSHAAVAAAAAVLANPTGYPPPSPSSHRHGQQRRRSSLTGAGATSTSSGSKSSRGNGGGAASASSAAFNGASFTSLNPPYAVDVPSPPPAAPAAVAASNPTNHSGTVLPNPVVVKGGSYANENPRLVVSDPLPTTTTSSASPSSTRQRGGLNGVAKDSGRGRRKGSGREAAPQDPSQVSHGSSTSGGSGASGRPRAASLPRTRDEVLPRLRPLRSNPDALNSPGGVGGAVAPPALLRPSPPPSSGLDSPASTGRLARTGSLAVDTESPREVLSAPPAPFANSPAGRRGRARGESNGGSGGGGKGGSPPLRPRANVGVAALHNLDEPFAEDMPSSSTAQPSSSGGNAPMQPHDGFSSPTFRGKKNAKKTAEGNRDYSSPAGVPKRDGDSDDDDGIWGDPEPEERRGSNNNDFGSTQLLSSIRPGGGANGTVSNGSGGNVSRELAVPQSPPQSLQQPNQRPPMVPLPARPPPPSVTSTPGSAVGLAAGDGIASSCSPAYKFNVVLSSGKTSSIPITLTAGSGCVQGMRPTMEDAHFTELNATHVRGQPVSLMAVLDGHCGRRVADLGARWLPHYLLHHSALGENNALAFVEAILQTDREIFHILQAKKNELEQQRMTGRGSGASRRRRDMYEEVFDASSGANGGSTLIAAAVCGRMLYVACLGDARAVLYDGQTTIAMSEDHKPGNPDESRRIAKCGGFVQFGRVCGILAVSRALGDFEFKFQPSSTSEEENGLLTDFPFAAHRDGLGGGGTPPSSAPSSQPSSRSNRRFISNRDLMVSNVADVRQLNLTDASAFLLLACDGLWDVLSNEEATEFVRDFLSYTPDVCDPRILAGDKPRPSPEVVRRVLDNCCQKLAEFAVDRGSMDNVSAMVLFFHDVVDTVARFNGRVPNGAAGSVRGGGRSSSSVSGRSARGSTVKHGRGSVQSTATSSSAFELTNNQVKVRNGRVVARH